MKKSALLLVGGLIALALTGCSLFASGSIQINDGMAHEVPTDLDYANEYVYYAPEISSETNAIYEEQYGTALEKEFFFLYSDENDTPLRAYYYLVLGDEAGAQKVKEHLEQSGEYEITVNGKNLCYVQNQNSLSAGIDMLIAMGIMSEKTGKAYADMYCEMENLIEYVSK